MLQLDADQFRAFRDVVAEALDVSVDEIDVRSDYSGRYMYGKKCLAVVFSGAGDIFKLGVFLGARDEGLAVELACQSISTDSMAGDTVAYWPYVTVAADDEED